MNDLAQEQAFEELHYQIAELRRMISNLIRVGTVKSFDPKTATAVLDLGFETHDVDVGEHGGAGADWRPLKKGQQITALCPEGDIANACVIPGGFHEDNKAPSQSADEDIRAQRGEGDKAVRLRTTDSSAELENKAKKTAVRAGDGVAELENAGEKSAVRAKKNGVVVAEVTDVTKFKIVINGQAFYVRPEALLPTSL
jgi:phage baseplate assembly protein gpV